MPYYVHIVKRIGFLKVKLNIRTKLDSVDEMFYFSSERGFWLSFLLVLIHVTSYDEVGLHIHSQGALTSANMGPTTLTSCQPTHILHHLTKNYLHRVKTSSFMVQCLILRTELRSGGLSHLSDRLVMRNQFKWLY